MDKIRRNERMSAMLKLLTDAPNRIFTLSHFCELFGAAKSTMSEDIDILRDVVNTFHLGEVTTVTGAAGGVRYRPVVDAATALDRITALSERLSDDARVLPGNFLYFSDILSDPQSVKYMGDIIATQYYDAEPDFVLTMETKGIPVAMATASALGVPLVIARHSSRVYEGPAVNINYVSGSSGSIQTMGLSRRSVREGQKALIVDDFLKGGGTAKGMTELMREFGASVVGMAFVLATEEPVRKCVTGEKALMVLSVSGDGQHATVRPADWLQEVR